MGGDGAAVRSWIQNYMDPTLIPNFAAYDAARELWDAIATTYFDGDDMLRLYELEKRVSRLRQAGYTIEQYYGELKSIWRDMDFRQPNPMTCTANIKKYSDLTENRRVLQFLGGLDDRLDPIRRDLLNTKPFPTVDQAFAAVRREYRRQHTMADGGENLTGIGMVTKGQPSDLKSSLDGQRSKATGEPTGGNGGNGGTTGKPPKCSHCGGKHLRETCFEVIGYPDWWKGKKGRASVVTGGGGQPSADQLHRGNTDGTSSMDIPSTTSPGSGFAAHTVRKQGADTEGILITHWNFFNELADIGEIGHCQDEGGGRRPTETLAASTDGRDRAQVQSCLRTQRPIDNEAAHPIDKWIRQKCGPCKWASDTAQPNEPLHSSRPQKWPDDKAQPNGPFFSNGQYKDIGPKYFTGPTNVTGFAGCISIHQEKSTSWLLDSGASDHMTYSKGDISVSSLP